MARAAAAYRANRKSPSSARKATGTPQLDRATRRGIERSLRRLLSNRWPGMPKPAAMRLLRSARFQPLAHRVVGQHQ